MSSYWEEDYFENSEYDEIIEELKKKVKEDIKDEIKNKLSAYDKLLDNNNELNRENYELKRENERIKEQYKKSEKEIKDLTIDKFVELIAKPVYTICHYSSRIRFKKCDRCDDAKIVKFTDPFGREASCYCPCDKTFDGFKVRENLGKEFSKYQTKGIIMFVSNYWSEYSADIEISDKTKYIEDSDFDYENIEKKITFNKGVAEKYCAFLNDKVRKEAEEYAKKYNLEIEEDE